MISLPLLPAQSSCDLCPLSAGVHNPGIPSHWAPWSLPPSSSTPLGLVVGMNPGREEDSAGENFVGPSGRMLRHVYLEPLGIPSLTSLVLGNAARCACLAAKVPARAYTACRPYLAADLAALVEWYGKPLSFILTLGEHATKSVVRLAREQDPACLPTLPKTPPMKAILKHQGVPILGNIPLFSTFHPAACLPSREPSKLFAVSDHLTLLLRYLEGDAPTRSSPVIVPFHSPHTPLPKPCPLVKTKPDPSPKPRTVAA